MSFEERLEEKVPELKTTSIQNKPKDDFDLFEELDAAYREDFLGERKGNTTGEGKFRIKSTFELVLVTLGLLVYLAIDIMIMIFIMQVTGLYKVAEFIRSGGNAFVDILFQMIP